MKVGTVYMLAYNALQFVGWCAVIAQLLITSAGSGWDLSAGGRAAFGTVKVLVGLAWLELLHGLVGLTRGSPAATFVQILGRFAVTFWICNKVPELMALQLPFFLFLVWAAIELVRYPYYALLSLNKCPPWLTWLRYTAFVPLYPLGIATEWFCYRIALPYIKIRDIYSVHMPNKLNFAFSFYYFICVVLVAYFVLGPLQFHYMVKQRRSRLRPAESSEGRTKAA